MPSNTQHNSTHLDWEGLATTLCKLPEKEKDKYLEMMLVHIHDLRQSISIIYAVEALLRRMISEENLENPLELLNAMQIAYQRMFSDIENMSNVFDAYDK